MATACGAKSDTATTVALDAPVSSTVPSDTTITVGDPVTQVALETSGLLKKIPFHIKFANLSGGPQTMEAFRGHALDLGSVADIPPIFANWTGLKIHIVAAKFRQDPVHHPIYELGIAPDAGITKLSDIKGKKVAFSPGQAQGALVLRLLKKLGLSQDDVDLVEIPSTEDVYNNALAAHQVDVAPLGGVYIKRYLTDYGAKGGTVLKTGIRDDASFLYAPDTVLADPTKAAAIKSYVTYWAQAQRWIKDHPAGVAQGLLRGQPGPRRRRRQVADPQRRHPGDPDLLDEGHRRAPGDHRPALVRGGPARHQGAGPVGPALPARRRSGVRRLGRLAVSATLDRPLAADDAVVLTVDERPRRRRLGPGPRRRFAGLLGPLLLLAAWALGSWTGFLSPQTLSPPWTVVDTAQRLIEEGRLQTNLEMSAKRALLGLVLGVSVGVVLALLAGLSRFGEAVIDGPVQMKRAIPALAIIPLLILWLGIGEQMKVITIALGVFVPIYLQTHAGPARDRVEVRRARADRRPQPLGVPAAGVIPGALPHFLLGLRFAVTAAWLALVVVEQVNATSGIGYMMELARQYGQTDVIIVGLVVYGLLGLISDAAVRLLQRKALAWQTTMAG